jgi:hypothetical protein
MMCFEYSEVTLQGGVLLMNQFLERKIFLIPPISWTKCFSKNLKKVKQNEFLWVT